MKGRYLYLALDHKHAGVVYINEAHRYFTAEADINGKRLRERFKF